MKEKILKWIFLATMGGLIIAACNNVHTQNAEEESIPIPDKISDSLVLMFYNVENLFDTIDDLRHNDNAFLPGGMYLWTTDKYKQKIHNIAKVIHHFAHHKQPPMVIGLAEVENAKVLHDLVSDSLLRPYHYQYIHFESPDFRGIDVALLYRKPFKVFFQKPIKVNYYGGKKPRRLRDILIVGGQIPEDTLFVIVNHWPSQRKGEQRSEPEREAAARAMLNAIKHLHDHYSKPKIIIMGDFNENPNGKAIQNSLHPRRKRTTSTEWYAPLTTIWNPSRTGSSRYKNRWNLFDQIFINSPLLNTVTKSDTSSHWTVIGAGIYRASFLLRKNRINRSFWGTDFDPNGYSDHLPVYVKLGRVASLETRQQNEAKKSQ